MLCLCTALEIKSGPPACSRCRGGAVASERQTLPNPIAQSSARPCVWVSCVLCVLCFCNRKRPCEGVVDACVQAAGETAANTRRLLAASYEKLLQLNFNKLVEADLSLQSTRSSLLELSQNKERVNRPLCATFTSEFFLHKFQDSALMHLEFQNIHSRSHCGAALVFLPFYFGHSLATFCTRVGPSNSASECFVISIGTPFPKFDVASVLLTPPGRSAVL